jgi:ATP-binding cassette subfamily B protein
VLQGYLKDLDMYVRDLQQALNEMEELAQLMAEAPEDVDPAGVPALDVTDGAIVFDRIGFRHQHAAAPLFHDFSLRIAAGERVGLVGRSGSGKSTLTRLLLRLHPLGTGCITIDGQDIAQASLTSLRRQIAVVPQDPILFHRSLAENIAYGRPGATQADIEQAARRANAHEFIAALPRGYQTPVGERGVKLSGGERQRIAIARAMLADAPILILDEATSSLDSESEILVQSAMERLMEGRTTLVIAHRLSTLRRMDRIVVLDQGRIVEDGRHEGLLDIEQGLYRSLFRRQSGGYAALAE